MNDSQNGMNNMNNPNEIQNAAQNDYYNNDAYYNNSNYDNYNNYSDTTYEEKEKKNGIWWKILLVVLVLLIIIILLLKFCTGGVSNDEKYVKLKSEICTAAEEYLNNNPNLLDRTTPGTSVIIRFSKLADANLISAKIENPYYNGGLFKKGTEEKYYPMNSSVRLQVNNDGSLNCELVDNANDTTAPELRLNGDAVISLAVGTEFSDPGYTATDDYDGDITDKVVRSGNVDYSKAGEYTLTYTVSDSAGNTTSKTRKVIYEEFANIDITLGSILDGVTPMISLKGANPYCLVKGNQYVEPGATATDNVDGNITDRIAVTNKVTGNLMGAFRVVYKVSDSSGNEAIAYRAVIVTTECPEEKQPELVANNAPVITLIGKSAVTVAKGTEYIDLGATAYDKEDGDLTSKIVTDTSAVNTSKAGVYKVHYRVTDSQGELATAVRTVTVKEAVSGNPSVRFTGKKENIKIEVGKGNDSLLSAPAAVNENGVAVAVTRRIEDYVTKAGVSAIDWNRVGKYRVIYTATHGNGVITQEKSIIVTIYETNVVIGGPDTITITKRDSGCDLSEADLVKAGVTFTASGNNTPIVKISNGSGIACKVGSYEIVVSASTTEGDPVTKKIKVNVIEGSSTIDVTAPSKVVIIGNSLNPSNVYNTNELWAGGDKTGVTISFRATPAKNTEIAHFEWSTNCSDSNGEISRMSATDGMKTFTEEGKNSICIRAVTTAGVKGPWSNPVKVYIDRTGPVVVFTHTWADKENDWHNKALTLTYKATDSGSDLDHFEYTYDDVKAKKAEEITTHNEATGSLTVQENTEPSRPKLFVYVRAVDKAGNRGEWTINPAYANIDTVKPNAPTLTVEGNNTKIVKLNATFKDGESVRPSGFGKLIYTINGGTELEELTQLITMPSNTTQANVTSNVKVWAVDKAGNRSDGFAEETVTVAPMKKPATGVDITNNGDKVTNGGACKAGNIYVGDSFTLVAKPTPADADEKDVIWSSSNGSVATVDADGKVTIKSSGNATITAKIGNASTTCTISSTTQVEPGYTPSTGDSGCYGKSTPVGKGWCRCDYNKHDWVCENDGNGSSGNKPSGGGSGGNNTKPSKTTTTKCKYSTSGACENDNRPKCDNVYGTSMPVCTRGSNGCYSFDYCKEVDIVCKVSNCAKCSSNNYCSSCNDGFELKSGKCVKKQQKNQRCTASYSNDRSTTTKSFTGPNASNDCDSFCSGRTSCSCSCKTLNY